MRGGARNYFPLPAAVSDGASLGAAVDFYNVNAHGVLTGEIFKIPDNTYILFLGEAGKPIIRQAFQIPDLSRYRFLQPGEDKAAWLARQHAAIQARTFFGSMLFKADNPYAPNTTAIYEPGDLVQDLALKFHNASHPFLLVGVWSCPMDADIRGSLDNINNQMEAAKYVMVEKAKQLASLEEMKEGNPGIEHMNEFIDESERAEAEFNAARQQFEDLKPQGQALEASLKSDDSNLTDELEVPVQSLLSDVVKKIHAKGPKIKFIVVEACRSLMSNAAANMNMMQHVVRAHRANFEHQPLTLASLRNYEQKAYGRRRMSLLARQLEVPAAAAGGAAAAAAGAGGGAAVQPTALTPSFRFSMSSLEKVPGSEKIREQLNKGETLRLDELEAELEQYLAKSKARINAELAEVTSGLSPAKQFKPNDFVFVHHGFDHAGYDGIIIGPVVDSGYVLFKVVHYEPSTNSYVEEDVEPLHTIRSEKDEAAKQALIKQLQTVGYDVGAKINGMEARYLQKREEAREENTGRPSLRKLWPAAKKQDENEGNKLQAAWDATEASKLFAPKTGVRLKSSKLEMNGQIGTVVGIGTVPAAAPAPEAHWGKLRYSVFLSTGKMVYPVATMLEQVKTGGRRKTRQRRNRVKRRRTHRR